MKAELIVDAPITGKREIWVKKINKQFFDHPLHFHDYYELVFIEKSYGKMIIGDFVGAFSEDELIITAPNIPHLWRNDETFYKGEVGYNLQAIGIYFPANFILGITENTDTIGDCKKFLAKVQRGIRLMGKTRIAIIELVKKVAETKNLEQLVYFFKIIHIISTSKEYELITSLGYKTLQSDEDMERYNNVYKYLLQNFQHDITLAEVAAICNMVPNAFCRYFKTKTHKTFTQFLNELRIGYAKKLLLNHNLSVQEVCYECGYNNPTNFYKFFKKSLNKSPLEYRRQFEEVH